MTTEFITAVEHYCEGGTVAVGCKGPQCEHAEGDDDHQCEPSFSWGQCDSCGSTLGGDRDIAWLMPDDGKEPIELSICVDCVMFHANGELPETWS